MSSTSETTTTANGSNNNSSQSAHDSSTKASTPVPSDDPYAYKKRKLVRRPARANPVKYKVWIAGHVTALVFGSISFIFQIFWLPNYYYINSISYRLSLIGSITALTATFSHKFGLHNLPNIGTLLSHQNFQYLVLATIWIFTFKSVFKILPYFILALLHIGNMKDISFIVKDTDFLASVIAYDELLLIVYLLLRTLFFRNASGYQLTIFLIFYWLRILYNKETKTLFNSIVERLDGQMSKIKNPKVAHYWYKTKTFVQEKQHADEFQ
ncbi:hypothetical protein Cantr_07571 [Candida viswanathii]|uniref:Nucleoporin POM33 n=1 Tax=Candida viswanathii TaxID=5486 RepID=A0A367Y028_9ASCO|nr:hypothetical protein Cantr_07571 [Candida viswanathii]